MQGVGMLLIFAGTFAGLILFIIWLGGNYSLNGIKSKQVGDGQHGTAKFADKKEIDEAYDRILFEPEKWRQGKNLPKKNGIIVGMEEKIKTKPMEVQETIDKNNQTYALVDSDDVHALMLAASGMGKTACFLYPNLEFSCACGNSFITTDTKGDLFRNYGHIATKYYGYTVSVIDLRNPMSSDNFNILNSVNMYMSLSLEEKDKTKALTYKAKAEKYAKLIAKTIIYSSGCDESFGQNQFFFDSAEGLITATILLIAEFGDDGERHIVSVFKLIQDLLAPSKDKPKENKFKALMETLPSNHKAKMFAGSALSSADQSMQSVMSTAMSRLLVFIDSEMEQILCFDTSVTADKFCKEKCAIFIVLPEEDTTKYPIASLIIQQYYRELLTYADDSGGRLERKAMFYLDELGTMPKIPSIEMMFSALRSRNAGIVAIIQSFAQFEKTYETQGCEIIVDNCQLSIFGGFAPNSKTAKTLSEDLGNQTILSGTVSKQHFDNPSATLQMIERALMTPDELKSMKKGNIIVQKTGYHPMKAKIKLFMKWGISFKTSYVVPKKDISVVNYIEEQTLSNKIKMLFPKGFKTVSSTTAGGSAGSTAHERLVSDRRKAGGVAKMKTSAMARKFMEATNHMSNEVVNPSKNSK